MTRIILQSDAKIIVSGYFTNIAEQPRPGIARLLPDGTLDTAFAPALEDGNMEPLVLQRDGRIIAARYNSGLTERTLVRLHNDLVEQPIISVAPTNTTTAEGLDIMLHVGTACSGCEVQWQHAGTNVAGGTNLTFHRQRTTLEMAGDYRVVIRNAQLSVTSGPVTVTITNNAESSVPDITFRSGHGADAQVLAVTESQKGILVGGVFRHFDGRKRDGLLRITKDGEIDEVFSPSIQPAGVGLIAVAPDQSIYIMGGFTNVNGSPRRLLARLHEDGSLDATFDIGNPARTLLITWMHVQQDGRLLLSGISSGWGEFERDLLRINLDGSIDKSLAFDGFSVRVQALTRVEELADRSILVSGIGGVALLRPDAKLVPLAPLTSGSVKAFARTTQGRIYTVGTELPGPYLLQNGMRVSRVTNSGSFAYPTEVALNSCGEPMAAGTFPTEIGWARLAQFTTSGNLNTNVPVPKIDGHVARTLSLADGALFITGDFTRVNVVWSPGIARIRFPLPVPTLLGISTNRDGQFGRPLELVASFSDCPLPSAQWYRDGVLVAGGTNLVLRIENPQANDSGGYTIVAVSSSGAVTSAPVMVEVPRGSILPGRLDMRFAPRLLALTNVQILAEQKDGRIVVSGPEWPGSRVIRLLPDGETDLTFSVWNFWTAEVQSLFVDRAGQIIVGGGFNYVNGTLINSGIARLSSSGELITEPQWPQWLNGGASLLLPSPGDAVVVLNSTRAFSTLLASDGVSSRALGWTDAGQIISIAPGPNDTWYYGGSFTNLNGMPRNRVGRVRPDGTIDFSFATGNGANGTVWTVAAQSPERVIIAGEFTSFDGEPRLRVASLRQDGSLDPSFSTNASPNSNVVAMVVQQDGRIIIAGDFTEVDGVPRPGLARLLANGELDLEFDPGSGANGRISKLLLDHNGCLLVAGTFSSYDGAPRSGLARVHTGVTVSASATPQGITFQALTASGWQYFLERTTSLVDPAWTPVMSVPGDGNLQSFTNLLSEPSGFYRLRVE